MSNCRHDRIQGNGNFFHKNKGLECLHSVGGGFGQLLQLANNDELKGFKGHNSSKMTTSNQAALAFSS